MSLLKLSNKFHQTISVLKTHKCNDLPFGNTLHRGFFEDENHFYEKT